MNAIYAAKYSAEVLCSRLQSFPKCQIEKEKHMDIILLSVTVICFRSKQMIFSTENDEHSGMEIEWRGCQSPSNVVTFWKKM